MAARCEAYVFCACALVALTQLSGCTDDGVSVHVICAMVPELEENICTYDPAGEECLLEGVMNLGATRYYRQNLRVESGLKPRAREVPPQAETNRVTLQSADVELRAATGQRIVFNGLPNPYKVTTTGYLPPDGIGVSSLTLIAPDYAAELARISLTQIVIAMTLNGETDGSTSVSSAEFLWPVTLINVSSDPAQADCLPIDACSSNFGQDSYALACRPE
jgi:hypothetical protein